MANLSSATGSAVITAKPEIAKLLFNTLEQKPESEYGICFTDKNFGESESSAYMSGSGRWSMKSTIESMFNNWIDLSDSVLVKNEWLISFSYVDEESGCQFITDQEVIVHHEADSNDFIIDIPYTEDYEWNWDNLVEKCGYDISDIVEWYDGEDITERIVDEAASAGMTKEEFLGKYPILKKYYFKRKELV